MPVSSYKEIVDALEDMIFRKKFTDRLPTHRQLVKDFRCSNRTVAKALENLIARGIVYSVPGEGTYVKKDG
jgi:DNA-binding GntR family transcriptional regulator